MSLYDVYKLALRERAREKGVDTSSRDYDMQRRIINSQSPLLGLKTPDVKKIAASVKKSDIGEVIEGYLDCGGHTYEDTLFVGCIAARRDDGELARQRLEAVIPHFDSWAHVDTVVPMLRWTDTDAFLNDFKYLLKRDGQYEKRVYIIYLMTKCLGADRLESTLDTVKTLEFGDYYVDMAAAWLISAALVKQYERTLPLIKEKTLPPFVHNKSIQKARESFRVPRDIKDYLKSLKIK